VPQFMALMVSNPAGFVTAAAALQGAAAGFTATGAAFDAGMATAQLNWKGQTKDRAAKVTERFVKGVNGMSQQVRRGALAAQEGGTALQGLVMQLRAGVMQATTLGFVVIPVGQAFPGPLHYAQAAAAGPAGGAVIQAYLVAARGWSTYFQALVRAATAQDQMTARAIQVVVADLDAQIPFRSSVRAPQWFTRGGLEANNQVRGQIADQANAAHRQASGYRPVGTQVGVRGARDPDLTTNVDHIFAPPTGGSVLDEVKSGRATLSPNQRSVLPEVRYGGPEFADDRAAPQFPRGTVLRPGDAEAGVTRWDVDALPTAARNAIYEQNLTFEQVLRGAGRRGRAAGRVRMAKQPGNPTPPYDLNLSPTPTRSGFP